MQKISRRTTPAQQATLLRCIKALLIIGSSLLFLTSNMTLITPPTTQTTPSITQTTPSITQTTPSDRLQIGGNTKKIDAIKTQTYYRRYQSRYSNKADLHAVLRFFPMVKRLGLDNKDHTVLVGGTNDAQLSEIILKEVPNITFYGFEIQEEHYEIAAGVLKQFPNAHMLQLGWDEKASSNIPIGGTGGTAGLFDPQGQRNWELQDGKTANTVAMAEWAEENNIHETLYVAIDTEGHEPKVLRGMKLSEVENQKRFPLIQYELGGTWAERDNRHGGDPWDQKETAKHLENCGYQLFAIGSNDWLAINSDFFDTKGNPAVLDEGYGPFIQGNVLAIHSKFVLPKLMAKIVKQIHVVET